jgi:lipopolysaccharide/colanic/teichoic acid biosynthesis glycosyltransferase
MTSTDLGGIVADTKDKNEKSKFGNVVTPFGKFLRKTRIDELPQCINLFRGDISLIGPRADIIGVYEDMKINVPNYLLRFIVPQGLTGWAPEGSARLWWETTDGKQRKALVGKYQLLPQ